MRITNQLLFATILVLSGCASSEPYFKAGAAVQVDEASDWYVRTERDWQCSKNLQAHFEVGLEFDNDVTVYYHHQSWFFCGGPFANGAPELYSDHIGVDKKWGGK